MSSIAIYVSNDLTTDQRMQRIANTLSHQGWNVIMIGILKKKSIDFSAVKYSIKRISILPEAGMFYYAFMNIAFFIHAMRCKVNVLYAVDLDTLPALRFAAWLRRKRFIWDCHEIFTAMPELYERPIIRSIWEWIERMCAPGISNVITVTAGVADYLSIQLKLNSTIIHNFPEQYPDHIDVKEKFDSKVILFQGALNSGRGLDILVKTMPLLDQIFTLEIIGSGPIEDEIKVLVSELHLNHRVSFRGNINPQILKEKTQRAFLGISLLDAKHKNSIVSLANKNLDYIMAGLPCITMDFPEYRKINDQWPVAWLLHDTTVETLHHAIVSLCNDYSMYCKMYDACIGARKVLNWEFESQKFIDFMNKI